MQFGVKALEVISNMFAEWEEDNEKVITKFHIWDELGWQGTRAIMDALKAVQYPHC